jgi:hypothetical protein
MDLQPLSLQNLGKQIVAVAQEVVATSLVLMAHPAAAPGIKQAKVVLEL